MAAFTAFAAGVVLKKLNFVAALWTFDFKNCPRFPVQRILSRTFHDFFPLYVQLEAISRQLISMADYIANLTDKCEPCIDLYQLLKKWAKITNNRIDA
jgi:hypothetical protein